MVEGNFQSEALGETIIPAINKLQDIFSQASLDFKLDLPQVAVIGSQSSGKSSVLEALVGRDFLPRGPEICTRRPLVLQLVKQVNSESKQEWGEFLHVPGKRFTDFELIRQEIQNETDRVTGLNKGVSDKPIRLKIFSPDVLTMTLVDLPGLARVPVGDQPTDIEERIRKMIFEYISHPTCLILAVSPSNADLVNSDALSMARKADPDGIRTIGVLTKLDIMDRGTNAASVLRNEVVPLQLGYIGVVNRCQQDIHNRLSMTDARKAEAEFFDNHPEYTEVHEQCGTANLARALNRILVNHIHSLLPGLRGTIEEELDKRSGELLSYGSAPVADTPSSKGALLLQLLDTYALRYTQMLEGCSEHMPISELAGGARIRHIFRDIFMKGVEQINPAKMILEWVSVDEGFDSVLSWAQNSLSQCRVEGMLDLTDEDIRTAIKNSGGVKGSLLIPDAPFELLVRRAISELRSPCVQCKDFVHAELLRIATQCAPTDVARFPALQSHLMEAVEEFINSGADPAERMIHDTMDCELAYINTDHPQFLGGSRAIGIVMDRRSRQPDDSSEDDARPGHSLAGDLAIARHVNRTTGRGHLTTHYHSSLSADSKPRSRVPLTDASNASSRLGLKGMEPALYAPEDLLGSDSREQHHARVPQVEEQTDLQSSNGWFSHWFRPSDARSAAAADALDASSLSKPPFTLRVQTNSSEQEEVQVEVTRLLVECYFDIARKNLQDAVPKAIMNFLVLYVQRGLQQRLIRTLYREELFTEVMNEREDIASRREACQKALQALHAAMATLNSLPQTLLSTGQPTISTRVNESSLLATKAGEDILRRQPQRGTSLLPPTARSYVSRTAYSKSPRTGAARLAVTAMASSLAEQGSTEILLS